MKTLSDQTTLYAIERLIKEVNDLKKRVEQLEKEKQEHDS